MFFSTDLLSLKANSGLGVVWLAGTLGQRSQARRILRRDYQSVDITNACSYLMAPPEPLSLRLSASLMVGVVRVYGQQCNFCYGDATALYGKLEQSLLEIPVGGKNEKSVNLDMPMQRARHDAITINGNGNQDVISSGNVWSELDKYRVVLEKTPEVERGRQLSSAGAKSDSTNSAIPGRIASTPLQFGAGDEGLLKELFGDLADLNNLQTPNSEDALLSGVFHAASHPGSLLDVPETITVNTVRPKRKPQVDLFDEITILSREEMFQEPLLQGPFNRGQSVDLGITHSAWDSLRINANIVVPPKKKRRSSAASTDTSIATAPSHISSEQSSPHLIDFEEDIIMPWSEPISEDQSSVKPRSSSTSRDSMGFMRFLEMHDQSKEKTFHFDDLFGPGQVNRRIVARAFHNVLQAAGDGRLAVNQICPFGRITIQSSN